MKLEARGGAELEHRPRADPGASCGAGNLQCPGTGGWLVPGRRTAPPGAPSPFSRCTACRKSGDDARATCEGKVNFPVIARAKYLTQPGISPES